MELNKLFGKKKKHPIDMLKSLHVSRGSADRISGGMMRLENKYAENWSKFIKHSLGLAENQNEENLIWYIVGVKKGVMENQGLVAMMPFREDKISMPS